MFAFCFLRKIKKERRPARTNVSGNALFLVLIAVFLFAGLSYAITQSTRGSGNLDRERRDLALAQLIQEIGRIQDAFDRMRIISTPAEQIQLCAPGNINGSCTTTGSGINALCTSGTSCLFAPEGGNLTLINDIPESIRHPTLSDIWEFLEVDFTGESSALGHGTSASDIMFENKGISLEACEALNAKLGLSVPLAQDPNGNGVRGTEPGAHIQCSLWFNGSIWQPKILVVLYAR